MGLGSQLISWDPSSAASRRARLPRHPLRQPRRRAFDDLPQPNFFAILGGDRSTAPYTSADMADDTVELLDGLGIGAAHVVGASMGGMIAQALALKYPERVLSLCSIMSNTGDRGRPASRAAALRARC